ncbi:unnamed protein product [Ectocarpus fasciculatus]
MFSGFDNFAEGFKRFSLDALQDQDDENATEKDEQKRLPAVPEQQHPTEHTESPTENPPPPPAEVEDNEWDWDQDNAGATDAQRKGVSGSQQRHGGAHFQNSPQAMSIAHAGISPAAVASPSELDQQSTFDGQPGGVLVEAEEPSRGNTGTQAAEEHMEERREGQMVCGEKHSGPSSTLARDSSAPLSFVEEGFSDKTDTPAALGRSETYSRTIEDGTEDVHVGDARTLDPSSSGKLQNALEGSKPLATDEGEATNTTNDSSASGPTGTDGGGERRVDHQENGESIEAGSSPQQSAEAATAGAAGTALVVEPAKDTTTADPLTVVAMRQELSLVKNAASGLEGALRESRSEVQLLRELLATEQDTTRKLSDEVNATRMGFQESNAAHQRTAEQSHALEEELYNTRKVVESLRAESAAFKAKVDEGVEDRHALEGKLRHLQAGLTEGQEAARQEGRQEAERLEARIRDLLKDRDRKQAELELQNARRKETREMARDLESQLAAVERIAQEREVELSKQRDDMVALKKNTGEATDQKKTWATKYEALERNFKQVRAQSKRIESELEEARENAARIEAEKAVLEERVEVEGAERVTVVASVSQERDFLLRQASISAQNSGVDRLEQEVVELRLSQEAQATAAAARAQTTGVLEEYRTRAQQALKRANEITSQTASENKRLEAEMSKLADEVAQQRPLWEKSKQQEEVHRAEVAELKEKIATQVTELDNMATAAAALEAQVSEKEEERRDAHTSVMRLEAQGKSLKQELQRQQKALAAAQENGATLQTRLADQEAALQAAENRQRRKHSPEKDDVNADMGKNLSSPTPAVSSLSMGWDEEKHGSRSGTPRRGMGTEAAGAAWPERRSLGESVSSMPSEADSADVAQGSVGEQLFYVHQLRERMSKEQIEMRSLISELEASRAAADAQAAKQAQLEKQLEAALLDKKRLQDLDSGRNAAINLEYLKNCVVGALRTSEPSEHARLLPVITTILKLSEDEAAVIAKNISTRAQHQGSFGGSLPPGGDSRTSSSSSSRSWWSSNPQNK